MIPVTLGGPVPIVILAAGASRRFGSPKQLFAWHGTPLLRRAVDTALGADIGPVVVVLGAVVQPCAELLEGLPVRFTLNAAWETGIASSIRAGVEWVAREVPDADALLLMACDQPLVTAEHLRSLRAALVGGGEVAGSGYSGTVGIPAAFQRSVWPELLGLSGDAGAKAVIASRSAPALVVLASDEAAADCDAPTE